MPEELREAIAGLILPAYQGLVLERASILERVAGELLVQALWAGCVQQLKYKRNYTKALGDDPFAAAGVVGDPIALLGPKIKAGNFLVKVQQARQKQEEAARKKERSALSDRLSAAGSGVGVSALADDRAGSICQKPPEGGTPTRREMSRCPGTLAEEPIGVGQTGFQMKRGQAPQLIVPVRLHRYNVLRSQSPFSSAHPRAAHTTAGGIKARDDAVAEEPGPVVQSRSSSRGTSLGVDESRKGDPQSGRRMGRFPGPVAEEREGVDQKGSVERSAAEEKKMGEKKIPSVDENGGAERKRGANTKRSASGSDAGSHQDRLGLNEHGDTGRGLEPLRGSGTLAERVGPCHNGQAGAGLRKIDPGSVGRKCASFLP